MKFWRHAICAVAAAATLSLLGGCDTVTSVKEENQQLREVILKQEKENRKLMAYLESLRNRGEGVDPAELQRLEVEISKRDQQLQLLRRALQQMQGQVALSQRLENKLQALADELGGELVGNKLMLPCDYFFASGRYDLMPEGRKKLQRFAEVMKSENLMLMIVGHTDSDPINYLKKQNITTNRQLSLMRSLSVLEALKVAGYPDPLMYPTGWGELKPVNANGDRREKQLNRRVEIWVDPAGSGLMNESAITNVAPDSASAPITAPSNDGGPVTTEN